MRSPRVAYPLAAAAVGAAVLLRWLLDPLLGPTLPLVTLFGAVAVAVWAGGYRPAFLAAILGYLACDFLFIVPRGQLALDPVNLVGLLAYLVTCSIIIGLGEAMRVARYRAGERQELLLTTLRSIGDAVITTDNEGRVTSLNTVAESLTGWSQQEAVGQPLDTVFRILNEVTRQPVENPAMRALRHGLIVGLANHTVLVQRDGGECPIDDSAAPIRDEQGRVSGCVLVFRDVTAQRKLQQERARQLLTARLLAAIVESSDDAIISKSLDGVIQSWNAGAERIFGYTAEQAVGRHISLVIPADRIAEEEDVILARLKEGQRIDHFETERVRADGQRIQVSLTISPIKDDAGRVIGVSKISRDITDRKRMEAEREKFVTLVETSTDFISMCDINGIPFFVNRAGLDMVGLSSLEEARRTPVAELFFPEDRHRIMQEFLPAVLEKGRGEIDVRFRHFKTGEARWMAYKVLTLTDADGQPVALATVSQDVTERKRLADDLQTLTADLSEADRRKNEFLAMLAHELRNPLAPISNAVQVLRQRSGDTEAVRAASEVLERQVAHVARLVDDLLDMSRITRGRIELRRERVELARILQHAIELTRAQYRSMGHELTVTLPPEPVYLDADPTRLAQVVGNLLNNACKFTDRGGHIRLTAERDGGQAVIRVRDDGIGVAAEQLPRLFEMFTQLDTSLERSRDGLGIGLTLVRMLVEMHGGTVDAHSAGLGRGSEFVVRLPVLEAGVPAPHPAARAPEPSTARRILVVDDNVDGAESLAMLLHLEGHEARTAHDGLEAIEVAREFKPDLVLLDIGLPTLNGYEVCRRMREEPWGKDVVLVAVTGWGQEEDRHRARAAGFDTHVVKPLDEVVLGRLLASLPRRTNAA